MLDKGVSVFTRDLVFLADDTVVDNASYVLVDTHEDERIDNTVGVTQVYHNCENFCLACFNLYWPVVSRQEYTTDKKGQCHGTYGYCYPSCSLSNTCFHDLILFCSYLSG